MNKWEFLENETKKQKEYSLSLLSEVVEEIYHCFDSIKDDIFILKTGEHIDFAEMNLSCTEGKFLCSAIEKELNKIKELEDELDVLKYQKENALKFKDKDIKTDKKEY